MAKINNFEVKKLIEGTGHEGEPVVDGSLYYKGKEIGSFRSSRTGGCMDVYIPDPELNKLFYDTVKRYIENFPEQFDGQGLVYPELVGMFDDESFILELITIKDWEKLVRKTFKEGAKSAVMVFDKTGLEKGEYIAQRASVYFSEGVFTEAYQPPVNHIVLRFIHSLAAFNIEF